MGFSLGGRDNCEVVGLNSGYNFLGTAGGSMETVSAGIAFLRGSDCLVGTFLGLNSTFLFN